MLVALNLIPSVLDFLIKVGLGFHVLFLGLQKSLALLALSSRKCFIDDRSCLLLGTVDLLTFLRFKTLLRHGHRYRNGNRE